ncbi:MAG: DNA polymerase, partial [Prochlorothrix sp.]
EQLAYLPLGHRLGEQEGGNLDLETTLEALRPILESADYPKALQNAKFDRLILQHQGIILGGVVWDTLLASYVLNPSQGHSLDALADRYLQIQPQSYKDLVPKGKTIADVSIAEVAQYCGMDVHVTRRLVPILGQELAQCPALEQLRVTVEQPLEPVLAAMEDRGVRIDTAYLGQLSQQLEQELARLEDAAHQAAGIPFNLASPKQLSTILFENLGLDVKKSRKIKTGYSTDAAVLEKLRGDHPVVDSLLEHRTLAKLKSTYVDALPALVQPQTQRIHTDFNQAVTATGRLSSSNPNLQNIPIRTAFSRQIRKAFVPEPGWLMVAADYSQIELRILAHMSQEPILLEAYRTGEDVHTLTARLLLEKDEISSEERRLGKVINFGVIYGMGAQRFARETGVSLTAAKGFLQRFHDRYPQVF